MAGIWVFADNRDRVLELLSAGRSIADGFGSRLVAFAADRLQAGDYIDCGADKVFLLPAMQQDQPLESVVPVLADAAREKNPDVILIGASSRGKEIGARLAASLNSGLCSGCIGFELDTSTRTLKMDRLIFGGAGVQTVVCTQSPQIATVPPKTFDPALPEPGRTGEVHEMKAPPPSPVRVLDRVPRQRDSVDITEAKIVVCAGRGLEKKEDLDLVRGLADALGAEVGCSRPVAEELQWLPEEVYIGISGKKVKPSLYIGVGVSGQVQHITGIRDSKVIMAINRDENAPIFEAADYGIVGDLYHVIPKLIEELKEALGT
jgi:electron transfer flavoprotein alpha subunit